jgi:hypothetical protein
VLLSLLPPSFRRDPNQSPAQLSLTPFARLFVLESCTHTTTLFHGVLDPESGQIDIPYLPTFTTSPYTCEIDHRSGLHPVFFFCCEDRANFTPLEAFSDTTA